MIPPRKFHRRDSLAHKYFMEFCSHTKPIIATSIQKRGSVNKNGFGLTFICLDTVRFLLTRRHSWSDEYFSPKTRSIERVTKSLMSNPPRSSTM